MTDDLTAFVTARLAEDEAAAKESLEATARSRARGLSSTIWDEQDAAARRALREVEAKRRMLAELDLPYPDEDHMNRLLAAAWSDHPGYRQEWAPDPASISP